MATFGEVVILINLIQLIKRGLKSQTVILVIYDIFHLTRNELQHHRILHSHLKTYRLKGDKSHRILESTTEELARYENHKKFPIRYKNQNIFPGHVQHSNNCTLLLHNEGDFSNAYNNIVNPFKWRIMKLEISMIHCKSKCLIVNIEKMKSKILNELSDDIINILGVDKRTIFKSEFVKTKRV